MSTHSSILAWKIPQEEEPGRLQSMGSQRVGHNEATSLSLFTYTAHLSIHGSENRKVFLTTSSQDLESALFEVNHLIFLPPFLYPIDKSCIACKQCRPEPSQVTISSSSHSFIRKTEISHSLYIFVSSYAPLSISELALEHWSIREERSQSLGLVDFLKYLRYRQCNLQLSSSGQNHRHYSSCQGC